MNLYKATILSTFGAGSSHPFRAALVRLTTLFATATGVGIFASKSIASLPVTLPPNNLFMLPAAFAVQMALFFTLLTGAYTLHAQKDQLARLLVVWPLPGWQRAFLLVLPQLVLGLLALALLAWPLGSLCVQLGLPPLLLAPAITLGFLSGFGLTHLTTGSWGWQATALAPAAVWLQYHLLSLVAAGTASVAVLAGLGGTFLILGFGGCLSIRRLPRRIVRHTVTMQVRGQNWPRSFWLIKKIFRTPRTVVSLVITFLMSLALAWFSWHHHDFPSEAVGFIMAILAGTFVADIRPLTRRHNPAEITALQGTRRFMNIQIASSLGLGVASIAPAALFLAVHDSVTAALVPLLLGCASGMVVSTGIVPAARDISAQFAATLLIMLLLIAIPKVAGTQTIAISIGLSLGLLLLALGIEYRRHQYIWRKRHAPKPTA